MTSSEAIGLSRRVESLEWFASVVERNLVNKTLLNSNIPVDRLYIGYRREDNGYVIGYLSGNSSILDVNLLAYWWCTRVRELCKKDLEMLSYNAIPESFQPMSRKRYK